MISIKKNITLNLIKSLIAILVPMASFTYVSRVFGATNLGKLDYSKSIVQYFVIIGESGIPIYAVREFAKVKANKKQANRLFTEMFVLCLCTMTLAYTLFVVFVHYFSSFSVYKYYILIYSLIIGLNSLNIEWMFIAHEDYVYISFRTIIFQVFFLLGTFLFVKASSEKYLIFYAALYVICNHGYYILNLFLHKRYAQFDFSTINLAKHIIPILTVFAFTLSNSIYSIIDKTMLGAMAGDEQLGYYSLGTKLINVIVVLMNSIGAVFIARMTQYHEKKERTMFSTLARKGINLIMFVSLPLAIIMLLFSRLIVNVIGGAGYENSVCVARIMAIVTFILPLRMLIVNQILIPVGKEKLISSITTLGILFNICLNAVLIPLLKCEGASVATVASESFIFIACIFCTWDTVNIKDLFVDTWQYFVAILLFPVYYYIFYWVIGVSIFSMILIVLIGCLSYLLVLYYLKNPFYHYIENTIKNTIFHKS